MDRRRKLFLGKTAAILGVIPVLMWAHEYGPDPGYVGVPKELGTCLNSDCHTGPALNSAGGSVKVTFPGGLTYTPGEKQHLVVTIADPATTQRGWGFQLTARLASNTATMAGSFQSTDANTFLMCADSNLFTEAEVDFKPGATQVCPGTIKAPQLLYMEHSLTGFNATANKTLSVNYEFDWIPPATASGNVTFYVAANAGPTPLPQPVQTNAHVYSATYSLTPAAGGSPPAISSGGVVSAAAFGGFPSIAPGTWVEIFGSGLSTGTREWAGGDFTGVNAPNSLDNVKVTAGGQPAFIRFISPTQVNAQIASNAATGAQQMTVTNPNGTSAAYNITINAVQPGLLAPSSFIVGGKQYLVAQFGDGSFVLPPNAISGLTTRQAKPGETIVIYGIGFGPAATASGQVIPAGQIASALTALTSPIKMQFAATDVKLDYAGLANGFVGLYQFNAVVPSVPDSDLVPVAVTLNGQALPQTLFTAVKR